MQKSATDRLQYLREKIYSRLNANDPCKKKIQRELEYYLYEIAEAESLMNFIGIIRDVENVAENVFYSRIAKTDEYSILFDGKMIKICELKYLSDREHEWIIWTQSISLIK